MAGEVVFAVIAEAGDVQDVRRGVHLVAVGVHENARLRVPRHAHTGRRQWHQAHNIAAHIRDDAGVKVAVQAQTLRGQFPELKGAHVVVGRVVQQVVQRVDIF